MADFTEDEEGRALQPGLVLVSHLMGLLHQAGHVSAQQGGNPPCQVFNGEFMTVQFDSGKMHHWANFTTSSICQDSYRVSSEKALEHGDRSQALP